MNYSWIFAIRLNGGATLLIEAPDMTIAASYAEDCYGESLAGVTKVGPLSASITARDQEEDPAASRAVH